MRYFSDMMLFWFDFCAFVPILFWIIVKNWFSPNEDNFNVGVDVYGALLLTAFASSVTWI